MNYWLMKSEPDVYSIDDLAREQKGHWDGVRNYQARNFMKNSMKKGDLILFYHSNAEPAGIAGLAEVASDAYPDFTQFEKASLHFEPRATKENPVWFMVDIKFVKKFTKFVSLDKLKTDKKLSGMMVTRRGMRLSIQPVEKDHYDYISTQLAQ